MNYCVGHRAIGLSPDAREPQITNFSHQLPIKTKEVARNAFQMLNYFGMVELTDSKLFRKHFFC